MKLLTVLEAAEILGVKEKTIRDWIWKRRIETVRDGGRYVRISESAIRAFIETHTVPAKDVTEVGKKTAASAGAAESESVRGQLRVAPSLDQR